MENFDKKYSTIVTDHTFETRLKAFDQRLKLMFDQIKKRWCILEWAYDNSGWNLILVAENDKKEPMPLGDWVFEVLYDMRQKYDERAKSPDKYCRDLMFKADFEKDMIDTKISIDHQHKLGEDRNEWRRAYRGLLNLPTSDVTAGYPKT